MRSVILLAMALAGGSVALAQAAPAPDVCTRIWYDDVRCFAGLGGIAIEAEREDESRYFIEAAGCLQAPGRIEVAWYVELAEPSTGHESAPSIPTGDEECPHLAVARPPVGFGTFDPPHVCALVVALTTEGAASRVACEGD